jgi:TPR repeat protein
MRWRLDIGIAVLLAVGGASLTARGDDTAAPPIVERLQRLAIRGDSDAALQLGVIYDTGKGVGQDFDQAIRWYRQAAVAGNAFAAYDLGALYDAGRGASRDAGEAVHWYRVAAERGLGRAAYALGVMTEAGDGTAPDPIGAARWYHRALAGGVEAARDRLVALGAARELAAAAPRKNPRQEFSVAVTRWRANGIDGNDVAAYDALQAAATDGLPLAQYDLAYSYEHGVGVGVDLTLAYAWYRAAAASSGAPALKAAAAVNRDRLGRHLSDEERQTADLASSNLVGDHPEARR